MAGTPLAIASPRSRSRSSTPRFSARRSEFFATAVGDLVRQMKAAGFGGQRKIAQNLLRNGWSVSFRTVGRMIHEKPRFEPDRGHRHSPVKAQRASPGPAAVSGLPGMSRPEEGIGSPARPSWPAPAQEVFSRRFHRSGTGPEWRFGGGRPREGAAFRPRDRGGSDAQEGRIMMSLPRWSSRAGRSS